MPQAPRRRRWLQFGIVTLLFATSCVAGFLAGYRSGFVAGVDAKIEAGIHTKVYHVKDIVRASPNSGTMGQTLVHYIKQTVSPRSWSDGGGPGSLAFYDNNQTIVVSNGPDEHYQVADTLKQIRLLQQQGKAKEVESIFALIGN